VTQAAKRQKEIEFLVEEEYIRDKSGFERDAATRRSKARQDLRERTNWADEQIEGWAIMLERNVRECFIRLLTCSYPRSHKKIRSWRNMSSKATGRRLTTSRMMTKAKTRVKTEKWPQPDRRLTGMDEEGDVAGADVEVAEVGGEVPVDEMEVLAIVRTKTRTRTSLTGAGGTKSYRVSVNLKADYH